MAISVFYGAIINPVSLTKYDIIPRCLLAVGPGGTITFMLKDIACHLVQDTVAQQGLTGVDIVHLKDGEFIIPGFIDTHTHAPQFPNIGWGQQYELLEWLEKVTFPMEKKFINVDFAIRTYKIVVRRTIDLGTTTCCYYGSLHYEATTKLANIVHEYGQRAFVGKCNMNRVPPTFDDEGRAVEVSVCPEDDYIEPDTKHSIETTVDLIKYIHKLSPRSPDIFPFCEPLVKPILTPRFALSCTDDLLAGLGALAYNDRSLNIQTHIAENPKEIADTLKAFPKARNYADVYNMFGLLRHNTILGHGVHLDDAELKLIKEKKASISHCPVSNFNLRSGVAQIGKYLDLGIKVGLGTDVSGGFSPSMLTVIQHASLASKVLAFRSTLPASGSGPKQELTPEPTCGFANRQLSVDTLFYLATLGGARACDIDKHVGSFAPGKSFDALLVSVRPETGNALVWNDDVGGDEDEGEKIEEFLARWLERFLFGGDDRNILRVYVQGRLIGGKSFQS